MGGKTVFYVSACASSSNISDLGIWKSSSTHSIYILTTYWTTKELNVGVPYIIRIIRGRRADEKYFVTKGKFQRLCYKFKWMTRNIQLMSIHKDDEGCCTGRWSFFYNLWRNKTSQLGEWDILFAILTTSSTVSKGKDQLTSVVHIWA